VVVDGNGNCLFYALLTVAGRPLEDQMSLRELCADYFTSQWHECPPGSGRRSSTYGARLNDCYSGEPAFRGISILVFRMRMHMLDTLPVIKLGLA
jgi:hypothetical protein